MKTKRSLLLVCALVVLTLCVTLCACNTSQAKPDYDYLVTFDYNVGTLDANCQTQYLGVKANSLVGLKPGTRDDFKQYEASGYYLEGWYLPEKMPTATSSLTRIRKWSNLRRNGIFQR